MNPLPITSQLALRLQKRYTLEAQRVYRAIEIVRNDEIKLVPSGNYIANRHSKSSRLSSYQVNLFHKTCQCDDAKEIRDSNNSVVKPANICKHQIAALFLRELGVGQPVRRTYDELLTWVTFEAAKQEAVSTGEPRVALIQKQPSPYSLIHRVPAAIAYGKQCEHKYNPISEREELVRVNRPARTEWQEEL